jgi:hypothetical protein
MIFSSIYFFVVNHCLNKFNLIDLLLLFFNYIIKLTKLVKQVKSITQILFFLKKILASEYFFYVRKKLSKKK